MRWTCTVDRRICRLSTMLCLTLMFFLVELIYGHIINSLALVSDSYHMLSDVVAIVIAIISIQISKGQSPKNTYGWVRAEVLGALVNSVFLLALCFAIVVGAIQRLTTGKSTVSDPDTLLYIGIVGLIFNLIALALFHRAGHGHSHACARKDGLLRATRRLSGRQDVENVEVGEHTATGSIDRNGPKTNGDIEAGNSHTDREKRNAGDCGNLFVK